MINRGVLSVAQYQRTSIAVDGDVASCGDNTANDSCRAVGECAADGHILGRNVKFAYVPVARKPRKPVGRDVRGPDYKLYAVRSGVYLDIIAGRACVVRWGVIQIEKIRNYTAAVPCIRFRLSEVVARPDVNHVW